MLILRLRSTVNAASPVNRLPPETLSQIFSHVSAPNTSYAASGFAVPHPFCKWAVVTHVCRYWRAAAVSSPNLWSKIDTPRPELMELFLSRSGARPLEVYAFSLPKLYGGPPLFGTLLPHLNRLKSLSFQMSQQVYGADYILAEVAVPSLERLYISGAHGDPPRAHPINWISRLFGGNTQAPRLQHLCLSHILFVSPFKFDNLSRLHFDGVPFLETYLPAVLETLSYNPNLRELLLSQSLEPGGFNIQPLSKPHIPLHSLQKFLVKHMSTPATVYLLSALELRENGLALHFKDISNDTDTFAAMFPLTFPRKLSIFDAPKVELDSTRDYSFVIQATGPTSSTRIEASIPYHAPKRHAAYVLDEQHPCPYVVKELWIHAQYHGPRESLYFIPGSQEFPNVETLVIKASESTIINELCCVIWLECIYPQLSTLVVYIPCWTFVDFRKFAEALRCHRTKLRTVRVGAVVWVDREAAVEMLEDVEEDNETLTFEVEDLNLYTDFGGMELPEVCTVEEDTSWWQWKCGICTSALGVIKLAMEDICSQETDLDQWSQIH